MPWEDFELKFVGGGKRQRLIVFRDDILRFLRGWEKVDSTHRIVRVYEGKAHVWLSCERPTPFEFAGLLQGGRGHLAEWLSPMNRWFDILIENNTSNGSVFAFWRRERDVWSVKPVDGTEWLEDLRDVEDFDKLDQRKETSDPDGRVMLRQPKPSLETGAI